MFWTFQIWSWIYYCFEKFHLIPSLLKNNASYSLSGEVWLSKRIMISSLFTRKDQYCCKICLYGFWVVTLVPHYKNRGWVKSTREVKETQNWLRMCRTVCVLTQHGQEHLGHSPDLPTSWQSQIHHLGLGSPELWEGSQAEPHQDSSHPPFPPCCSLPFCLFLPKQQLCSTGFLKMFSNIFPKTQTDGTYWSPAFCNSFHPSTICPSLVARAFIIPLFQMGNELPGDSASCSRSWT